MSTKKKLLGAASGNAGGGGGSAGTYVDDVFSTYVYTGNGGTQTIENGIDLSGEGGLVWFKHRDSSSWPEHHLFDTERGLINGPALETNSSNSQDSGGSERITSISTNSFTVGKNNYVNAVGIAHASWTWRKAPSFFDVVTYTGDGGLGTPVEHNLGVVPGAIWIKRLDSSDPWIAVHRKSVSNGYLWYMSQSNPDVDFGLNSANKAVETSNNYAGITDTSFNPGGLYGSAPDIRPDKTNRDSARYVAYLFAHDDSDESMIKCGSYTGNGIADGPEIDLGWEPQWLLIKCISNNEHVWNLFDSARGIVTDGNDEYLLANDSAGKAYFQYLNLTSTGFKLNTFGTYVNGNGYEYIYMAIRRPNKPAEEFEPEELFTVVDGTTTDPAFNSGFVTDFNFFRSIKQNSISYAASRLTGTTYLALNRSDAEVGASNMTWDFMDGFESGTRDANWLSWMWRRAPHFFDVVTWIEDGTKPHNHSLGVPPEIAIVKSFTSAGNWTMDVPAINKRGVINSNAPFDNGCVFGPYTSTDFHPGGGTKGIGKIAYLWASVPGICDIGSYVGTGADLNINCGFTNGARFVLIRRTNSNGGDWMYFDTLRGIRSSSSSMLTLNTTNAEAPGSYIKPHPNGFTVTSNLTGISGSQYIYMAIA